jgi:hypothetical protein
MEMLHKLIKNKKYHGFSAGAWKLLRPMGKAKAGFGRRRRNHNNQETHFNISSCCVLVNNTL